MSNIQYAFIDRKQVPGRSALQASIDTIGFDLKLHPEYTPFDDSGFLPFVLDGEEGPGFEIEYGEAGDLIAQDIALRAIAGNRDYCISMAWHGSMRDLACAMIVSYALTKDFGAVVSYEGAPPEPVEALLSGAHEALREARIERKQPLKTKSHPNDLRIAKPWWRLW